MAQLISVAEAAVALAVHPSRVRAMIQSGQLRASKVADRWLVDPASVERRLVSPASDGRPFEPENAWAVLLMAEGESVGWLNSQAKSRIYGRLQRDGLRSLAPRLRNRAAAIGLFAHSSALQRIAREPEIVKGGVSAAAQYGGDVYASHELEAYVSHEEANALISKYHLRPSPEPNVVLHVLDDHVPVPARERIGPAAVALDLFESSDARSRRAGQLMLERIDREIGTRHQQ